MLLMSFRARLEVCRSRDNNRTPPAPDPNGRGQNPATQGTRNLFGTNTRESIITTSTHPQAEMADQLLEKARNVAEGQIDFEGQKLAELLSTALLAIVGVCTPPYV
jgi:hypothetical protein